MFIIGEIIRIVLENFNSCWEEVLSTIEEVLEDVKKNKVIKKRREREE